MRTSPPSTPPEKIIVQQLKAGDQALSNGDEKKAGALYLQAAQGIFGLDPSQLYLKAQSPLSELPFHELAEILIKASLYTQDERTRGEYERLALYCIRNQGGLEQHMEEYKLNNYSLSDASYPQQEERYLDRLRNIYATYQPKYKVDRVISMFESENESPESHDVRLEAHRKRLNKPERVSHSMASVHITAAFLMLHADDKAIGNMDSLERDVKQLRDLIKSIEKDQKRSRFNTPRNQQWLKMAKEFLDASEPPVDKLCVATALLYQCVAESLKMGEVKPGFFNRKQDKDARDSTFIQRICKNLEALDSKYFQKELLRISPVAHETADKYKSTSKDLRLETTAKAKSKHQL